MTSGSTTVSFHELFHYDHGPTLAAMIESFVRESQASGRRLLLVFFRFLFFRPLFVKAAHLGVNRALAFLYVYGYDYVLVCADNGPGLPLRLPITV